MDFGNIPDDLREQIAGSGSAEEAFKLIENEGVELTEDQLEMIAGGDKAWGTTCPNCGSHEAQLLTPESRMMSFRCENCGYTYEVDFGDLTPGKYAPGL